MGKVVYICIRPQRSEPVTTLSSVTAVKDIGLAGDYYDKPGGNRQVTLISSDDLRSIAEFLGESNINPGLTRRNIVVDEISLSLKKGEQIKIGEVTLEYTGICDPCNKMNKNLGPGGREAMIGHCGITAKVISGGRISVGDSVFVF